ncbi:putative serine esterase-domain-containing protein [Xylogone sp. PMI_703]|nr:putative serine esterase-domain-containing protein [Xylogone sp. PMI_703]
MKNVALALRQKHPEDIVHILVAKRNSGSFTYDGIELGGERVCREIEEEVERLAREGQEIKKLSIVGYSLGGLVARYTVGLLESSGFFDKVEPVNFTTFASPHLGVRTPLRGWPNHIWNVLGARTLSQSGRQLFTIDNFRDTGKPLLEILADPNSIFIKGLARFKRRALYTNIVNDRSAVYYTTGITKTDPYTDLKKVRLNYMDGYEDVLLDPEHPFDRVESKVIPPRQVTAGPPAVFWVFLFFLPVGVVAFLCNSVVQSIRSNKRIQLHERGLAGIEPSSYRVPLLIQGMREAVEDAYENLNSSQNQDYLNEGSDEDEGEMSQLISKISESPLNEPESSRLRSQSTLSEKDAEASDGQSDLPTLALAPYQFRMIKTLDSLGWLKFPVHIHKATHSHAAIIVRSDKEMLSEGRVVLRHWLDEVFIL